MYIYIYIYIYFYKPNSIKKFYDHKFHKIFNRNTLKFSYSCMPNEINSTKYTIKKCQTL